MTTNQPQTLEPIDGAEVEDADVSNSTYKITSYGVDYTVDSLVKRLDQKDIVIPGFQRRYVWSFNQACRFIESLLLGLPVPGIFLSKDDERRLIVIDGQQRLRTLHDFYRGVFERKEFALQQVADRFKGKTYYSLEDEDRRQLDDSILHATIVQQIEPNDDSSIYHIFERLNTGGTKLQSQEIRASLYHGKFYELLKELNRFNYWRLIYGPESKHLKDQELILRFFALYFEFGNYKRPMNEFLNFFMRIHRDISHQDNQVFSNLFMSTITTIYNSLGENAFRPQRALNTAVYDAVMIGIARALTTNPELNYGIIQSRYAELLKNLEFIAAYTSATTDKDNLISRISLATQAFAFD